MATSAELRRGGTCLSDGRDSDILLGPTITSINLAAELAKYTAVQPGTVAWNRIYFFNPSNVNALIAFFDTDGKWYNSAGAEVT